MLQLSTTGVITQVTQSCNLTKNNCISNAYQEKAETAGTMGLAASYSTTGLMLKISHTNGKNWPVYNQV